jgi:hypothetical protein
MEGRAMEKIARQQDQLAEGRRPQGFLGSVALAESTLGDEAR